MQSTASVIGPETTPIQQTDIVCHVVDDEALIYDAKRNATHRLNCTAYFIWKQCDGTQTCERIASELTQRWDAKPEQARTDVLGAIERLATHGLIKL